VRIKILGKTSEHVIELYHLDLFRSEQGPVEGSFEKGNEHSRFRGGNSFVECLRKKYSLCSWPVTFEDDGIISIQVT